MKSGYERCPEQKSSFFTESQLCQPNSSSGMNFIKRTSFGNSFGNTSSSAVILPWLQATAK
jgi:hypothetical protein